MSEEHKDKVHKSRRKKIHNGEVLGFAKTMLGFLNAHYTPLVLEDIIDWDSVDDFGYSRDLQFYGDHIESRCLGSRKSVFRLFLDIIDFHCDNQKMPAVLKPQVFFARLALLAFLRHHKNTVIELPPWKDFPRNEIAAHVISEVLHLWYDQPNGSSYRGIWEDGESLRIMDGKRYENVISFAQNVWAARLI